MSTDIDNQYIFSKQELLYNPKEHNPTIFVYGLGSGGSHLTIALAKTGITNITVYDFDFVELDNIPAQFYTVQQGRTKMLKTLATAENVKNLTNLDIQTENVKIDDNFQPQVIRDSIHVLAIDNIETRKLLANKLKGFPVHVIDGRIGGFNYELHYFRADNQKQTEDYLKTLEGSFAELRCGEKCLWALNALTASKTVANIIKLTKEKPPSLMTNGHLLTETVLEKKQPVEAKTEPTKTITYSDNESVFDDEDDDEQEEDEEDW